MFVCPMVGTPLPLSAAGAPCGDGIAKTPVFLGLFVLAFYSGRIHNDVMHRAGPGAEVVTMTNKQVQADAFTDGARAAHWCWS